MWEDNKTDKPEIRNKIGNVLSYGMQSHIVMEGRMGKARSTHRRGVPAVFWWGNQKEGDHRNT
jgi:hypothetical protein